MISYKNSVSRVDYYWLVLTLLAVFLSFVAAFSPLIKIPLIGKVSYWKADSIASLIYLFGTLLAIWLMSKDDYRNLWLPAMVQMMSFGFMALSHIWASEQRGYFLQAVDTISSPVTKFTTDVLLNRATWQFGMLALICSFFILLLVSALSRSR